MGWTGLASLILLLAWPVLRGLGFAFGQRRDPRGDIVLGASVAILVTAFHGLVEWIFVTSHVQYMFAIAMGIIAGSIRQHRRDAATMRYRKSRYAARKAKAAQAAMAAGSSGAGGA
jgi:O-antigen ligase